MKFISNGTKLNLFLIFSVFLFIFSVNSIKIKKLTQNQKLDDSQKRDILMKMSQTFIFANGASISDKFRQCVDEKQATKTFNKAMESGKRLKETLEGIGKECYNNAFVLPQNEEELKRTLDIIIEQTIIKFAAVDGIISAHRGSIPYDYKKIIEVPS